MKAIKKHFKSMAAIKCREVNNIKPQGKDNKSAAQYSFSYDLTMHLTILLSDTCRFL